MSCGCTYHPFCLIMFIMELKVDACARLDCREVFSNRLVITSFGFKHIHVPMMRIKLENLGCSSGLGHSTTKSFQGSASTKSCKIFNFLFNYLLNV